MKVGDYVRTKYGEICKLNNIIYQDDNYIQYQLGGRLEDKDFLKSSPNIMDLIEVGDYVDRLRVTGKQEDYIEVETFDEKIIIYKNEHIKSVLTKEQFERMEYKIGE